MAKSPRSEALFREVLTTEDGRRTVRIAAYKRRADQVSGVTLGLGYTNPDAFAKIYIEVTPELWLQINVAMEAAFAASDQQAQATLHHTAPVGQAKPRPASVADGPPSAPGTPTVVPPTRPNQPARRRPRRSGSVVTLLPVPPPPDYDRAVGAKK